jgi:hypothetical protein
VSSEPGAGQNQDPSSKFKIDFIDPLFAVAIHIGFVEGLLKEEWLQHHGFPTQLQEFANICMFVAALSVIVASWVGYHLSIYRNAIVGDMRFVLDIVLLILYIFLLLYFQSPSSVAVLMALIFVVYTFWDYFKTIEHAPKFYPNEVLAPGPLKYLRRCIVGWLRPTTGGKLMGEIVTFGWTLFYLLLIPVAFVSLINTPWGRIVFAVCLFCFALTYRSDKHTRGFVICSIPCKVLMVGMLGWAILFWTDVLDWLNIHELRGLFGI